MKSATKTVSIYWEHRREWETLPYSFSEEEAERKADEIRRAGYQARVEDKKPNGKDGDDGV